MIVVFINHANLQFNQFNRIDTRRCTQRHLDRAAGRLHGSTG